VNLSLLSLTNTKSLATMEISESACEKEMFFSLQEYSSLVKSNGEAKHSRNGTKSNNYQNSSNAGNGGGLSRTVNNTESSYRTEMR